MGVAAPGILHPDGNGQTLWEALEKASSEAAEAVSEDLNLEPAD